MASILDLYKHGQSLWLDYIDRNLLTRGGLERLIAAGVRGVTTNPTIFHKAITSTADYDDTIRDLLQADPQIDVATLYEWLTVEDVQMGVDILRPVYDESAGVDGYVSLEVSPHLAYDTAGTIEAARHLWKAVHRPNLMIKVPATREGLPAIERLIAEGVNVNVTLLFSVLRYQEVAQSYLRGLAQNPEPRKVASVASFFVSRVDTKVDRVLDLIGKPEAPALKGRIGIANCKMAYRLFRKVLNEEPFGRQRERGARAQRLLWASTSTKDPRYSDVLYVEGLVGADTVNTVPAETLDAFLYHGEVRASLEQDIEVAERDLEALKALGISIEEIARELEEEGVAKFAASYDQLIAALKEKRAAVAKDYASR